MMTRGSGSRRRARRPRAVRAAGGIAGLHAIAPTWAATDWPSIARLYDRLVEVWPSPSAQLGRIVARGYSPDVGPEAALAELDADPAFFDERLAPQAYAVRGDLARLAGDRATARAAYRRAIELEPNARVRRFLAARLAELGALAGPALAASAQRAEPPASSCTRAMSRSMSASSLHDGRRRRAAAPSCSRCRRRSA